MRFEHAVVEDLPAAKLIDEPEGLETGYARAVESIVELLVPATRLASAKVNQVTILAPSMLTPGDVDTLKDWVRAFGLSPLVIPDFGDSVDGHLIADGFSPVTYGGVTRADIERAGQSVATSRLAVVSTARRMSSGPGRASPTTALKSTGAGRHAASGGHRSLSPTAFCVSARSSSTPWSTATFTRQTRRPSLGSSGFGGGTRELCQWRGLPVRPPCPPRPNALLEHHGVNQSSSADLWTIAARSDRAPRPVASRKFPRRSSRRSTGRPASPRRLSSA